jgi:hypothetical protein
MHSPTKSQTATPPTHHRFSIAVGLLDLAIHTHTSNPRRTHILHVHQPQTDAHTYNAKHTHTPLLGTSKHGALLARAAADGADLTFHKQHTSLTDVQFTHKQELMWEVHNTRLLSHSPTLRCPMRSQFTSNSHMAGNCPSMSGLRHDSAFRLLLSCNATTGEDGGHNRELW